jgi:hypothetical protein
MILGLQRFLSSQMLCGTSRSHGRFQPRGNCRRLPFLPMECRQDGFGFPSGAIDFCVRPILHGAHMRRLGLTFGHDPSALLIAMAHAYEAEALIHRNRQTH